MRRKWRPYLEEEGEEPLINLTSLIDVVFVILIAFILIAPMLDIDSVELASGGNAKEARSENTFLISLRKEGDIWVKGKKLSLEALRSYALAEQKRDPTQVPQLAPDKQVSFGAYQQIKTVLEEAGFAQMDVILKKEHGF